MSVCLFITKQDRSELIRDISGLIFVDLNGRIFTCSVYRVFPASTTLCKGVTGGASFVMSTFLKKTNRHAESLYDFKA